MTIIDNVNFENLISARNRFENFRQHLDTEQEKAGAIQAYEYSYELAWKTMRRLLEVRGVTTNSPRDTFREAALNKMIAEPEIWFEFVKIRNITVHTYHAQAMDQVLAIFESFSRELTLFLHNVGVPV